MTSVAAFLRVPVAESVVTRTTLDPLDWTGKEEKSLELERKPRVASESDRWTRLILARPRR